MRRSKSEQEDKKKTTEKRGNICKILVRREENRKSTEFQTRQNLVCMTELRTVKDLTKGREILRDPT